MRRDHQRLRGVLEHGQVALAVSDRQPERDALAVRETLAGAGLTVAIETRPLSMEDTFVSVLRGAGLGHA